MCARGNLSVTEKDAIVRQVEALVIDTEGVRDVFAFAGDGGLNNNTGGVAAPVDTIGQIQLDLEPWGQRPDGDLILARLQERLDQLPGIATEIFSQSRGPASGKPMHLRLSGDNWDELQAAAHIARGYFNTLPGLTLVEDTPAAAWHRLADRCRCRGGGAFWRGCGDRGRDGPAGHARDLA